MSLDFHSFQLAVLFIAVFLTEGILNDGSSNWLEGAQPVGLPCCSGCMPGARVVIRLSCFGGYLLATLQVLSHRSNSFKNILDMLLDQKGCKDRLSCSDPGPPLCHYA